MADGWICDSCGEIAVGDLCKHCGRQRHATAPVGPAPGSYLSMIGYRTMDSFKFPGLFMAFVGTLFFVLWGGVGFSVAFKLVGLVVLVSVVWRYAPVLYYGLRRNISRGR
jgi:hypothetical protein